MPFDSLLEDADNEFKGGETYVEKDRPSRPYNRVAEGRAKKNIRLRIIEAMWNDFELTNLE